VSTFTLHYITFKAEVTGYFGFYSSHIGGQERKREGTGNWKIKH